MSMCIQMHERHRDVLDYIDGGCEPQPADDVATVLVRNVEEEDAELQRRAGATQSQLENIAANSSRTTDRRGHGSPLPVWHFDFDETPEFKLRIVDVTSSKASPPDF